MARKLSWGEESSWVRPVSGCAVGRRSDSPGILEQSQIGDIAALGFLPKRSDCGEALSHKRDRASAVRGQCWGRVVLRAEQRGAS